MTLLSYRPLVCPSRLQEQGDGAPLPAIFRNPALPSDLVAAASIRTVPSIAVSFECALLKSVKSGKTERSAAIAIIRTARSRGDKVWRLLRELDDIDEELSLGSRFKRTTKRLEGLDLDDETAGRYGELTLAFHELNVLLSEAFYPGDP